MKYDFTAMYWAEEKLLKWPEDYETFFAAFDLPVNTLVHVGHCTLEGGCKYGDDDCPIFTGKVEPIFTLDDEYELTSIPGKGYRDYR